MLVFLLVTIYGGSKPLSVWVLVDFIFSILLVDATIVILLGYSSHNLC